MKKSRFEPKLSAPNPVLSPSCPSQIQGGGRGRAASDNLDSNLLCLLYVFLPPRGNTSLNDSLKA